MRVEELSPIPKKDMMWVVIVLAGAVCRSGGLGAGCSKACGHGEDLCT